MELVNLVVIGSGWYGLAAAKHYIDLHPTENVLVLDAAASLGGIWAKERLYPDLRSDNLVGMLEYPDFPMDEATFGVKPYKHVPGPVVHRYLTDYAKKFGVYQRLRLTTRVDSAERSEKGDWVLRVSSGEETSILRTEKFDYSFEAPIFHSAEFAKHSHTTKTSEHVVVLGSAKSAWDITYAYAAAGATVNLVVRESGKGPTWMAPIYVTPLKIWIEKLITTRLLTWFSPCIWGSEDGYGWIRSCLHGTAIGRWFVDKFWGILESDLVDLNGYDTHSSLEMLKPWHGAFWSGTGLSIFNYPTNVLDFVRQGKIRAHIADVTSISKGTVHLSTGVGLGADTLVCATGWKHRPPINFIDLSDEELGLPFLSTDADPLAEKADREILTEFPRLRAQPQINNPDRKDGLQRPYRQYRFIVPPSMIQDRTLAFAGMASPITTAIAAHVQGLWISAYLDGTLERIPATEDAVHWQAILHSQWDMYKYPLGMAAIIPELVFDVLPYLDLLLRDLGVNNHRKAGWFKEFTQPYGPGDYRGIVDEYKERHSQDWAPSL
ncbi:hypothetical protein MBLNU459_g6803t1 [Dothideomycetes sp. NU459]